ncbi:MAG: glycosyltransferase family 39 protein [Bryobacteraceae bacterium]
MQSERRIAIIVAALTLAGLALRLDGITTRSISHPEMWVPLIPLPWHLADPGERATLYHLFETNLTVDTHPAGYYVFMWCWMKVFGHSLLALRLPSVIFGTATIPLVYGLGALAGRRRAGLIAAGLLALHGYHAAWSGFARMYALEGFLAVASAVLLLRSARAVYVLSVLCGVFTHVFFWPFLAVQMVWTALAGRDAMVRLQIFAVILASPVLAFSLYQSHHGVATLSGDVWPYAREFVQFAFLAPHEPILDLYTPEAALGPRPASGDSPARWAFLGFSALLLGLGLRSIRPGALETAAPLARRRWQLACFAAAAIATSAMLVFVWRIQFYHQGLGIVKLMTLFPLAAAVATLALGRPLRARRLASAQSLPAWLGLGTFTALAALSQLRPMLTPRGLLFLAPFLLLVLSMGIEVCRRWFAIVVASAVAAIVALSLADHGRRMVDPMDFAALYRRMEPHLQPRDRFFLRRGWDSTPMLYYLLPHKDRVVVDHFTPSARVWALSFYGQPDPPEMTRALAALRPAQRFEAGHGVAVLYVGPPE